MTQDEKDAIVGHVMLGRKETGEHLVFLKRRLLALTNEYRDTLDAHEKFKVAARSLGF